MLVASDNLAKQFWYVMFLSFLGVVASRFLLVLFVYVETVTNNVNDRTHEIAFGEVVLL